jgi:hypothetical protein
VVLSPVSGSRQVLYCSKITSAGEHHEAGKAITYHSIYDFCSLTDRARLEAHLSHVRYKLCCCDIDIFEVIEIKALHRHGALGHRV